MKAWFAIPLWQRVIGALILGIIVGYLWGPGAASIKIIGDIFHRLYQNAGGAADLLQPCRRGCKHR